MTKTLEVGKWYLADFSWVFCEDEELRFGVYNDKSLILLLEKQDNFSYFGEKVTRIKFLFENRICYGIVRYFEFEYFHEQNMRNE